MWMCVWFALDEEKRKIKFCSSPFSSSVKFGKSCRVLSGSELSDVPCIIRLGKEDLFISEYWS